MRFLTRRFIGEYSSVVSTVSEHSAQLEQTIVPLQVNSSLVRHRWYGEWQVWDTLSVAGEAGLAGLQDNLAGWPDLVFILYR